MAREGVSASAPIAESVQPIDVLRVVDLKEELAKHGLPKHGIKRDQVKRLTNYLQKTADEEFVRSLIESAFWYTVSGTEDRGRDGTNKDQEVATNAYESSNDDNEAHGGSDKAEGGGSTRIAATVQQGQVICLNQFPWILA